MFMQSTSAISIIYGSISCVAKTNEEHKKITM